MSDMKMAKFGLLEHGDADDYQTLAGRTLLDKPKQPLSESETMLLWNALKLAGETGELGDFIAKGIFHNHGLDGVKIRKELGDILWYIAAISTHFGWSLKSIMVENITKLEARYPNGFTEEDSRNRNE